MLSQRRDLTEIRPGRGFDRVLVGQFSEELIRRVIACLAPYLGGLTVIAEYDRKCFDPFAKIGIKAFLQIFLSHFDLWAD